MQRIAYWIWSRVSTFLYRKFPIFGRVRGSVGIIELDSHFLVLERNDGLGLCFPGGLSRKDESNLETLRRELMEETGLILKHAEECFSFESDFRLPGVTTVFLAMAEGTPRGSWEGTPLWLSLPEMEKRRILTPHREIVNYLKNRRVQ